MKKIKRLLRRHKRLLAQCALFTPLAFFSGINFLTPLLLIFVALTLYGLRALYGNDPYVKNFKSHKIPNSTFPTRINKINDVNLGTGSLAARKRIYGF